MRKEDKDYILDELSRDLSHLDKPYRLDGPLMLTVKKKDETYRKRSMPAMDFFPEHFYVGARDVNFCFVPEDPQEEWNLAEVPAKDMDTYFPLFLEDFKDWAVRRFISTGESRVDAINNAESVKALLNIIFNYAEADEKTLTAEEEDITSSLPTFGMF